MIEERRKDDKRKSAEIRKILLNYRIEETIKSFNKIYVAKERSPEVLCNWVTESKRTKANFILYQRYHPLNIVIFIPCPISLNVCSFWFILWSESVRPFVSSSAYTIMTTIKVFIQSSETDGQFNKNLSRTVKTDSPASQSIYAVQCPQTPIGYNSRTDTHTWPYYIA